MRTFTVCLAILVSSILATSYAEEKNTPTKPAATVKVTPAKVVLPVAKIVEPKVALKEVKPSEKVEAKAEPVKAEKVEVKEPVKAEAKTDVKAEPVKTPTVQEWWQLILSEVIKILFGLLLIISSVFVGTLAKKYKFTQYQGMIDDILNRSTAYVEQITLKKVNEGQPKTSGADKVNLAVSFAKALAKDYKVKEKSEDWWKDHIEAWLNVSKVSETKKPA